MYRITLVRHGETFQNRYRMVQGQDPTQGRLTGRGVGQARLLGRALAGEPFQVAWCSPLERAVLTLSLVLIERSGERTLPLRFPDALREINLGALHGASHAEWRASITGDPMAYRPPGGESWLDVQRRATEFLRGEVLANGERNILIVAHGGVNRGLIASLTGLSMAQTWQGPGVGAPQDNACINRLVVDAGGRLVSAEINDTSHLAGEEDGAEPRLGSPGQRWRPAEGRWEGFNAEPGDSNEPAFLATP